MQVVQSGIELVTLAQMKNQSADLSLSPVLFVPHGGGPMPLLNDAAHSEMLDFLGSITSLIGKPDAILLISAHWEESSASISSSATPPLIYDYYNFPEAAYEISYPAAGAPELANTVFNLLQSAGIEAKLDAQRGFDHGLFVPLKIMFPKADIPCVQLSILNSLDPQAHIELGEALRQLREKNVLIIGSGFSFHNMKAFKSADSGGIDTKNEAFERWLIETCTDASLSEKQRKKRLIEWHLAPHARYCHPREEHLLPLHVCYGLAGTAARLVFDGRVIAKKTSAYLW